MIKKKDRYKPKKIATLFDKSKVYDFGDSYRRIYVNGRIEYFNGFRLCEKKRKKYIDNIKGFVLVDGGLNG